MGEELRRVSKAPILSDLSKKKLEEEELRAEKGMRKFRRRQDAPLPNPLKNETRMKMKQRKKGPPLNLKEFFLFKIPKCYIVFLTIHLLWSPVAGYPTSQRSKQTEPEQMCEVCLDHRCATDVRKIYVSGKDNPIWNGHGNHPDCSKDNLKANVPCQMMNGRLVVLSNKHHDFEGDESFRRENIACSQLNFNHSKREDPSNRKVDPTPSTNGTGGSQQAIIRICVGGLLLLVLFG
ncbi:hypothetical protein AGOR_G00121320 [Albula goreensis]|uniref:Uncharacterized protein n=1 Tax=Albula goreensis TaxID=1534307 RepID=A0A8T3DCB0_9TELE|nr:hypothetical protein AGOR_G00121320 [Albula goreensis]